MLLYVSVVYSFFIAEFYSILWIICVSSLLLMDIWATTNKTAVNVYVQVFVRTRFPFSCVNPRRGLARLYCEYMLSIIRNRQIVFQNGFTILHSH